MARRPSSPEGHDPSRREFFRTFGRQTIQNAGAVAGAAAELRRTSLAVARDLLDINQPVDINQPAAPGTTQTIIVPAETPPPTDSTFRSAYRFSADALVLLDQRELPARTVTFETREPTEIASAMRAGAITAGPVLAEVAAYGVVVAAAEAVNRPSASREQMLQAALGTLRAARRDVHALTVAVDRMAARFDELANADADGPAVRDGLAAEADAIAGEAAVDHAAIGRVGAAQLGSRRSETDSDRRPLQVLVFGDSGPLTCGLVGMSSAVFQMLTGEGRQLHVWVPAAAPSEEGTHITALQLTQTDVPHTVLPDVAIGWLFANRSLDAVFLRGDTVCVNGDTVTLIGARAVAQLAHDAGVPVYVLTSARSVDPSSADAGHLLLDLRSAAELATAKRARLNPANDIVPASLINGFVTAQGVHRSPAPLDEAG